MSPSDPAVAATGQAGDRRHKALILAESPAEIAEAQWPGMLGGFGFDVMVRAFGDTEVPDRDWRLVVVRSSASGAMPWHVDGHRPGRHQPLRIATTRAPGHAPGLGFDAVLPEPLAERDLAACLLRNDFNPVTAEEARAFPDVLCALADGDRDFIGELVQSLVQTNREDLQAMIAARADGRWDDIASLAHRIKGSARLLKCESMVAVCAYLESLCRAGNVDAAAPVVDVLAPAVTYLDDRVARCMDA